MREARNIAIVTICAGLFLVLTGEKSGSAYVAAGFVIVAMMALHRERRP